MATQATYDAVRLATEMAILEALTEIRDLLALHESREDSRAKALQSRHRIALNMIKKGIDNAQTLVEPEAA